MSLFSRKKKIVLYSEHQKDDYIEKLDRANISYKLDEKVDSINGKTSYILNVDAADLKKVV